MISFFFSSRRRHTRCGRDWSSDVCSSDLEYYDHSISKLPIFVHTRVQFGQAGGTPMSDISFVLSKDAPTEFVSVTKNELEKTAVYPNPATENLNIQLPSSIESEIGRASCRERV